MRYRGDGGVGGWGGGWVGEESEGRSPRGSVQGGTGGGLDCKRLSTGEASPDLIALFTYTQYPPFPTLIGIYAALFWGIAEGGGVIIARLTCDAPQPRDGKGVNIAIYSGD